MTTEVQELSPLAEAPDFEAFKKLRHAEAPAEPAGKEKTPQTEEVTPISAATEGTAETEVQEATEATPPAEKSVEDQIKELRSKGKHAAANKLMVEAATKPERERAERAERELEALKSRPSAQPAQEAKPAQQQQLKPAIVDSSDPEPLATDAKYGGEGGYEKYLLDKTMHATRAENRAADVRRRNDEVIKKVTDKWNTAKAKYADFETITFSNPQAGTGLIPTPAMVEFVRDHDLGMDVLYELGKNIAEYNRIKTLTPALQFAEMGYMARLIATPPVAPEKLKPAVSLAKVPPRVLSGHDEPEAKSTAEAKTFEDFKRIRHRKPAA